MKEKIISNYGKELYQAADEGLNKWVQAADEIKEGDKPYLEERIHLDKW